MKISIALIALFSCSTSAKYATYRAEITELSSSGVTGTAVVFAGDDMSTVGYAGHASGLSASLGAANCTATNGCGAHIHSGKSCITAEQGGHYYLDPPVSADPWTEERYDTDASGEASFAGIVMMGTDDLEGRAFIIHDEMGARVGCGLLQYVEEENLLKAKTEPLSDSGVTATVTAYQLNPTSDTICFFGKGSGLESNLNDSTGSCTAKNGCGVHVHGGDSCLNSTTQGGHYYDSMQVPIDPWLTVRYEQTSSNGTAYFTNCVKTGETEYEKPFVVHANDGSRISCGLLKDCKSTNACSSFFGLHKGITMHREFNSFLKFLFPSLNDMCVEYCVSDIAYDFWASMGYKCGACLP